MERGMNKIVLVTRKTRLEELVYKYNTVEQARFYMEHMGVDFSDYVREDKRYHEAVEQVKGISEKYARVQRIDREFLPNMIFGERDVVITVGQDGLVANVMKYLEKQPLIGINPDPERWDGVLLPFVADELKNLLPQVLQERYHVKSITMAEAVSKDGQRMLAVNDLFIGCRTHTSARYELNWNGTMERQSSSGIIISTGLGATGWYKSVIAQAKQMVAYFGCGEIRDIPLQWGDEQLTFVVREPYPSRSTQAGIVFGKIDVTDEFQIVSNMPMNGVVFSDGMEEDAIEFNSGTEIIVKIADKKGCLVV